MKEKYSKNADCLELARYLKQKMGNKIEFYGHTLCQEVMNGKYFHQDDAVARMFEDGLPFCFKFCKEGFLRIGVGSFYPNNSIGEKLAALSNFYEVLSKQFGEPTVFYTIKEDDEGWLSLQWSFVNKEEEVKNFKNGSYFTDAEIDKLIVMGDKEFQTSKDQYSDLTRKFIAQKIGIPIELLGMVDENIDDFVKYKKGEETCILDKAKNDDEHPYTIRKEIR